MKKEVAEPKRTDSKTGTIRSEVTDHKRYTIKKFGLKSDAAEYALKKWLSKSSSI
jgi:hypothetical protein